MLEPKYGYSPIFEAVCEFRFEPGQPWDLAVPGLVYEILKGDFPIRRPQSRVHVGVSATEEGVKQSWAPENFIQFLRSDEKALVQIGRDFVSINHFRPYPKWEKFLPLIKKGFEAYSEITEPKGLRRIGLRYVNKIEIPGKGVDFEQYFSFRPFLGPKLPQKVASFFSGVLIPYESDRDLLSIQFKPDVEQPKEKSAFVLDLDYFTKKADDVRLDGSFAWVDTAHQYLEQAFEGCITDKLRDLFRKEAKQK